MKEELVLQLLEGQKDILTGLIKSDQDIYDSQTCPRCGGAMNTELDVKRMLNNHRPIPRRLCRCVICGCLIDPFSKLILEMGNLGKTEPPVPLIHKD